MFENSFNLLSKQVTKYSIEKNEQKIIYYNQLQRLLLNFLSAFWELFTKFKTKYKKLTNNK